MVGYTHAGIGSMKMRTRIMTMVSTTPRASRNNPDLSSHDTQVLKRVLNPEPSMQSPHRIPAEIKCHTARHQLCSPYNLLYHCSLKIVSHQLCFLAEKIKFHIRLYYHSKFSANVGGFTSMNFLMLLPPSPPPQTHIYSARLYIMISWYFITKKRVVNESIL